MKRQLGDMKNVDDLHFLSMSQLDKANLIKLLELAKKLKSGNPPPLMLSGKTIALLFFQPSTRTRFSFEIAIQRLGGRIIGFDTPEGTRAGSNWNEYLEDTARVLNGFVDGIVLRHAETQALHQYVYQSRVPVINAGNGSGEHAEHPTQALLDVFTIYEEFGTLENLAILIVGALSVRTVPSFILALRHFPSTTIHFLVKSEAEFSPYLRELLEVNNMTYKVAVNDEQVLSIADVVYHHGIIEDRYSAIPEHHIFDQVRLQTLKKDAIILHSLPRAEEISFDVDSLPQARYFQQAHNGIPARMALLAYIFNKDAVLAR